MTDTHTEEAPAMGTENPESGASYGAPESTEQLPSEEELREERLRLLQEIRHHKDAQDSIALDIENQPGAADVYRTAARVQLAEIFSHRATEYVDDLLPSEISRTVTANEINTEKNFAVFVKQLQRKRDHILRKISQIQDRMDKRADPAQWYYDAVSAKYEAKTEDDKKVVDHTLENQDEIETLSARVSQLTSEKSAATAELLKEQRIAKSNEASVTAQIKKMELENTTHARQCREFNVQHGNMVSGLQVLMNLIETEHYGPGRAPSRKEVKQKVKEAIANADEDYFLIEPKDITEEDIERVQQKKGKKGKKDKDKDKEKKEKKEKKSKD